ncbi:putative bifunctional diguanylate cyclase/phosphodiesterase [Hylemonella gracilis]|uniref:Sensory box/GGDEF family protein n=1 Tax=Hylemonella gracilis ATCC 19624 TaxID=887062 RepID=F3KQ85_9BURK|nr:EAL domain-containing protein [Hylemonella gracilis]EGI78052.1 sensory box/GGDEF family protein [Hylemonella gracilis ATCC 19624]
MVTFNLLLVALTVCALQAGRMRFEHSATVAAQTVLGSLAQNMAHALNQEPSLEPERVLTRQLQHLPELQDFLGGRGYAAVVDPQWRQIVRQPSLSAHPDRTAPSFENPELRALLMDAVSGGHFFQRSPASHRWSLGMHIGADESLLLLRRIEGTDYRVLLTLSAWDYLHDWRHERNQAAALVLLFQVVSLIVSVLIHRAWRSQATALRALRFEKGLNQTIVRSAPLAIYTRDTEGRVTAWNPAAEKLFGWTEAEVLGRFLPSVPLATEYQDEDKALRLRVIAGESIPDIEVQRQKVTGEMFDLSASLSPLRDDDGTISGFLTIAADVTARKQVERQVEFLAYRDVLTGLPNRSLLQDRFAQAIARAERHHRKVALLFLDLDHFKTINDSLGHATGDALLKEVARRLSDGMRESDTISRQGGDEFLVVLSDLEGTEMITPVLLKIRERLQQPLLFDGHELSISSSIGVALYPDDGLDFETLLKKADTALYRAKDAGRNQARFFDEQMNTEAVDHLRLKNGLHRALSRGELELHYQPQFDLRTGAVIGVEALLRWRHPEEGLISPARFVPVAEDSGLIVPIGEWVIRQACAQAMAWRQAGLPPLLMAVNLSAVQFRRGDVQTIVAQALRDTGLAPELLELELTESILLQNTERVLEGVDQIKQLGVKLSIDDFGTGYSSLAYLKRFAVDKLKIDQSFVHDLARDSDNAAIVRAIIQMAAGLGLRTIAEGVEDAEVLAVLRRFGCDEAQGYFLARPLPATEFAELVKRFEATPFDMEAISRV